MMLEQQATDVPPDSPVRVGQMLFTLVDPKRGHEVAYNRWYERDHRYSGCMVGPGWFAGRRWVATKTLKDMRFPLTGPVATSTNDGSYLAVYWVHEPEMEEAQSWAEKQVASLYAAGRGFSEREHVHTGQYLPDRSIVASDDGVPLTLALDHDFPGLATVMVEPREGLEREFAIDRIAELPTQALLQTGAVDLVSMWRMKPWRDGLEIPMKMGNDGGTPDRILLLCFMSEPPVNGWQHIRDFATAIETAGAGRVTFASPFIPTEVGTDTYTDELW